MVQINDRGVNVAVLGATGQAGMVMRRVLDERDFPVKDLRFLASAHSAGKVLNWRGHDITVEDVATADLSGIDIAIFSAGGGTSKAWAPKFAEAGAYVIDNSSQWRMHDDVPLVVAEVNPDDLDEIPTGIVANPNCTTMAIMPVLKPLADKFGLKRLIVSSYQAGVGAGRAGVEQLMNEAKAAVDQAPTSSCSAATPSTSRNPPRWRAPSRSTRCRSSATSWTTALRDRRGAEAAQRKS